MLAGAGGPPAAAPPGPAGGQAFIIWQCLLLIYIQCNILFMVIFVFLQLQGAA